jgi:hypothetical protein
LDAADWLNTLMESKLKENAAPHIKNSDVTFAYIGVLCQSKNDFNAICEMEPDPNFYCKALGIDDIPSSETLRQRMDLAGNQWRREILTGNINLLKEVGVQLIPCLEQYIPLDLDVSPLIIPEPKPSTPAVSIFPLFIQGF